MKKIYFIFLIVILCIIQNTIYGKHCKKSKKKKSKDQFPPYVKTPSNIKVYISEKLPKEQLKSHLVSLHYVSCLNFKFKNVRLEEMGINFLHSYDKDEVKLSTNSYKPTNVYLQSGTVNSTKEVYFYIGLALGMIPELSRFDRNNYAKVFTGNILLSKQLLYKKKEYNDKTIAKTGFDFSSAMLVDTHYGSERGKLTYMSHLFPYYENIFYIFNYLSHNNVKRLNYLYCRSDCKKKNDCKNGGFYQKRCDVCRCPQGFTGKKCTILGPNHNKCHKKTEYYASKTKKELLIKNDGPFCVYSIKSKKGRKIQVTILDLKLSFTNSCEHGSGLEVKFDKDKGALGLLLCDNHKNIKLPALSSKIVIIFQNLNPNNMFKISYKEK